MNRLAPIVLALAGAAPLVAAPGHQESLRQEAAQSIRRGIHFLESQQNPATGAMGDPENPAITALAVLAIIGDPARDDKTVPDSVRRAFGFIASCAKPDGGIYVNGLANYNTSICLTALMAHPKGEFRHLARQARRFVIGLQQDNGETGIPDHDHDGGIGYGGSSKFSDLSNTHFALEALYHAQALDAEAAEDKTAPKLNWEAAIAFVSRCQNLKFRNDQAWVSEDPKNRGGFVYEPGVSKAGKEQRPDGSVALRSSGSISYAGLLSLIYARMEPEDPRVRAVLDWLKHNFSVTENPGLGGEGLFYYYHSMAKALTILDISELTMDGGRKVNWRDELGNELFRRQRADGSWSNATGRWRESDPIYATALGTLTLAHIYHSL